MRSKDKPLVHEQAGLVKTIGERLRFARESLCNLSQVEAAKRLGYANSAKLSKIERAADTNSIPLWLIHRAAKVYMVSVDYLFGLSEDWELGPRTAQGREVAQWVFDEWEAQRRKDLRSFHLLSQRQEALAGAVSKALETTEQVHAALRAFIELNPAFEDEMRGSAKLVAADTRAYATAQDTRAAFRRFKLLAQRDSATQPSLFDSEG